MNEKMIECQSCVLCTVEWWTNDDSHFRNSCCQICSR